MKKLFVASLIGIVLFSPAILLADNHAADGAEPSLDTMFSEGKAYVNARYRYEIVDQDGISKDADASTLRTRLGFDSGELNGFSFKLEAEDVSEIGNDRYNSTVNGKTTYPVVADPDGTEINQAWLNYSGLSDTNVRGGREALKLDNVRFIGDVGWRQNNQTYDGANISNESIDDLRLFYGYVGNVNRIFGEDSSVGDFGTNLHLFNAKYSGMPEANLTTYAYLFDVEDADELSTTNYGARLNGDIEASESLGIFYDAEYTYQKDYEDNPTDYSASYWRAIAGAKFEGFSVKAGFESLGSDDGLVGFSTPFATLHAWNGWADKFLATPATGLEDAQVGISYTISDIHEYLQKVKFDVVYHDFSADEGSMDYGQEWDFNLWMKLCKHLSFGVKYAMYEADEFATDTEKLIFTLQAQASQ